MNSHLRSIFTAGCFILLLLAVGSVLSSLGTSQALSADESTSAGTAEPAPPPGQTYIGAKKCSSCHFDQYLVWRKDKKHVDAFAILPAKYKNDASCLKCHTTGFGEESGYKTSADKVLAGITCEACHGPGSKHEQICKPLANVTKLSPEQSKMARDSIYLIKPHNVCITCHLSKAHKVHPKYEK